MQHFVFFFIHYVTNYVLFLSIMFSQFATYIVLTVKEPKNASEIVIFISHLLHTFEAFRGRSKISGQGVHYHTYKGVEGSGC